MLTVDRTKIRPIKLFNGMKFDRFQAVFKKDMSRIMHCLKSINDPGPLGSGYCGLSIRIFARENSRGQFAYTRSAIEKALFEQEINPVFVDNAVSVLTPVFLLELYARGIEPKELHLWKVRSIENPQEFALLNDDSKFRRMVEPGIVKANVLTREEILEREAQRLERLENARSQPSFFGRRYWHR